jgi:sigma-E factor negative regulatory protein RseA
MKDRISALMDGELDDRSAGELIGELRRESEGAEAWRTYHLIGDAMRDTRRLAAASVIPIPLRRAATPRRWLPLAAAAGAAFALVGWMAFAPEQRPAPAPVAKLQPAPQARPVAVPIPTAANDYLLAHQGFSPRGTLQGMASYVRTVSDEGAGK